MTMSFLKLGMAATPGKDRRALLMSRPPPGFRLISLVPMLLTLRGASSTVARDSATTSAASTAMAASVNATFTTAGRDGVVSISYTVSLVYPKKETTTLCTPEGTPSRRYAPSKSVAVPEVWPWSTTEANGSGALVVASTTFPRTTQRPSGIWARTWVHAQKSAQSDNNRVQAG